MFRLNLTTARNSGILIVNSMNAVLEATIVACRLRTCGDRGCTTCTVQTRLGSVIGASQETIRQIVGLQTRKIATVGIEAAVDFVGVPTGHIIGVVVLSTGGTCFCLQSRSGGGNSYADIGTRSHYS